jgi:hypothetical protein
VIRRLGLFVAGSAAVWLVTLALAWLLWRDHRDSLVQCSVTALVLCLVPTALTFLWSSWGLKQTADQQLVAVLGGTGVRMFFVLGLGLLLANTVDFLHAHQIKFWLWVLVFYMTTLALEMVLIVRSQTLTENASKAGSTNSLSQ